MFVKELPRGDNVPGSSIRITVMTGQGLSQCRLIGIHKHWSNRIERVQTHPSRAAAREKAKHHLFPEMLVGAMSPDLSKLAQPPTYLAAAISVVPLYVFDRDGFVTSFHFVV